MKSYGGAEGLLHAFLVSFSPRPFYPPEKYPRKPLNRRLDVLQTGLDAVEKRKEFIASAKNQKVDPGSSSPQPTLRR
jgi:hypothetical protein